MSEGAILAIQYTPASSSRSVGRAVGGFLRYVQYRDKHRDSEPTPGNDQSVSGLLKYVAYRDRTVPRGVLFGPDGPAGDVERRELARFVTRAVSTTRPQLAPGPGGGLVDRRRAVYRMVISPERAEGLDLRDLTRATMQQLAADAGGAQLRWVAAEHRNTAHPHVHVVLAGFTEEADGRFRGLVVNRARLQRMKDALAGDIARQRGGTEMPGRSVERGLEVRTGGGATDRRRPARPMPAVFRRRVRAGRPVGLVTVTAALKRAAARYRSELEREERATAREGGRER